MPPNGEVSRKAAYSCGVDIARLGEDVTCIIVVERPAFDEMLYVVYIEEIKQTRLNEIMGRIKYLDSKFCFNKVLIDSTGLGAGVFDVVQEELRGRVEDVVFTLKNKVSLYNYLKLMMQKKKIRIPYHMDNDKHKKLYYELLDLRVEYTSKGEMKLHHSPRGHDDYPDALALAVYGFKENTVYNPSIY